MNGNVTYSNLLLFSSISSINGSSFGNTGPTGPIGQASQISFFAPGSQSIGPSTAMGVVTLTTLDSTQTTGITGFTFSGITSLFTNTTIQPIPVAASYALALNTTAGGYSAVGLTVLGVTTYFGGMYNASNGVSNSVSVLVPAGGSIGLYYMDNIAVTVQTATRFTVTSNQVGQQGATGITGPTGPVGQVSQLAYGSTGINQTIVPTGTLSTLVQWPAAALDVGQSIGVAGLAYNFNGSPTGTFTNITTITLPISVEYTLNLSTTAGGYSAIGINGPFNIFGGNYNDNNGFSNTATILVAPGSYFGVYYMDNTSVAVLANSRISCTLLTVGSQGPTGVTGPIGVTGTTGTTGTTGPALWSATGSIAPYGVPITYAQGFVGVGVGPTGASFLQTNSGGSTAGTGSSVPQYTLDIIGSERVNGARLFGDGSAQVSATPALDYTTFGQNWTTTGLSTGNWQAVAVSANGQYQTAATNGAGINYSINYGQSWTASTGINVAAIVNSIAVSASGQYQLAAVQGTHAGIYYSTNYGASWTTSSASSSAWYEVCISASGQYASAVINSASTVTYYSMNYGITWIASTSPSGQYATVSCSASGQYQVAATGAGTVYYSSTYGQSWSASNMSTVGSLQDSAMSASGQYVSIATNAVGVWYSSNYGQTFVQVTAVIGTFNLRQIAMNASGQYQLVSGFTGGMYYSTNYGVNWTQGSSSVAWYSVAISANGQYCVGCIYGGAVYQSVTRSPSLYTSGFANVNGAIIAYNSTYTTLSVGLGLPAGLASGANYNSVLGFGAGTALTTGNANTFLGNSAGQNNTTASNNVFLGYQAGFTNTTGGSNTFLGLQAGYSCTTGGNNICIGQGAGQSPVTLTTGNNNIYIGINAAGSASGNSNEIVIGQGATGNGTDTITIGNSSTAKAVISGITMTYNSTFGTLYLGNTIPAGLATGANLNTFIGLGTGLQNTTGQGNTSLGFTAGYFNQTGNYNISIGLQAGYGVTGFSYSECTYVGMNAGFRAVGSNNTVVGKSAGQGADGGVSTYSACTIVGKDAGFSLRSGIDNTYLGLNAGYRNQTGNNNTYIGLSAGQGVSGQSNSDNTGVGYGSLLGITTGTKNVCVGFNCGRNITTASYNTAIGNVALYNTTTATTGDYNVALGHETLIGLTSGTHNVGIGAGAGYTITTGTYNICIGVNNRPLNPTDSYCTIIGGAGNIGFGTGTALIATSANGFYLPGYTTAGTLQNTATGQVISVSDIRVKSNIIYLPTSGSTDTIMGLKPVSFDLQFDPYKRYTGFIADEVQLVMPGCVDGKKHKFQYETEDEVDANGNVIRRSYKPKVDANGNVIYKKDENGQLIPRHLGMDYNEITSRLVLAFQEQVGIIQQQATTIISLQSQVTTQQTQMEQILQRLTAANIA